MRDEAREREREKRPRLSRSHKTNERIPFFSSLEGKRNAAETETKGKRSTTPFRPDGSNGEWGNVVLERCTQRCLERKGRRMTNPRFRSLLRKRSRSLVYGIGITSRLSFSLLFSIFRRSNEVQVEIKEKDKGQRKRGEENTAQIDYTSSRSSLAFFSSNVVAVEPPRNRDGTVSPLHSRSFHLFCRRVFSLPRSPYTWNSLEIIDRSKMWKGRATI